jgi:hypothetical protein
MMQKGDQPSSAHLAFEHSGSRGHIPRTMPKVTTGPKRFGTAAMATGLATTRYALTSVPRTCPVRGNSGSTYQPVSPPSDDGSDQPECYDALPVPTSMEGDYANFAFSGYSHPAPMISDLDICSNDMNAELLNDTFSDVDAIDYPYMPIYPGVSTCQDSFVMLPTSVDPTAYPYGFSMVPPTAMISNGCPTPPPEDLVTDRMGPIFSNAENYFPRLNTTAAPIRSGT